MSPDPARDRRRCQAVVIALLVGHVVNQLDHLDDIRCSAKRISDVPGVVHRATKIPLRGIGIDTDDKPVDAGCGRRCNHGYARPGTCQDRFHHRLRLRNIDLDTAVHPPALLLSVVGTVIGNEWHVLSAAYHAHFKPDALVGEIPFHRRCAA